MGGRFAETGSTQARPGFGDEVAERIGQGGSAGAHPSTLAGPPGTQTKPPRSVIGRRSLRQITYVIPEPWLFT